MTEGLVGEDGVTSVEAVREWINDWVSSPALQEVITLYGGPIRGDRDLAAYLDELELFTAREWDARRGRERNQADRKDIPTEVAEQITRRARDLGLVDTKPPRHEEYDYLLVLGGMVRACIFRTEYAAHLAGGLRIGRVDALAAYRSFYRTNEETGTVEPEPGSDEPQLLHAFGYPPYQSEDEVMNETMRRSFGNVGWEMLSQSPPGTESVLRSRVARATGRSGIELGLVIGPTRNPPLRANTSDTFHYWASRDELHEVRAGQRVLMVTSQIYIPHQLATAIEMLTLPHGLQVEMVGVDHAVVPTRGQGQTFDAGNYLQEFRSALFSFRSLLRALDEV
jgi:hypothetical protein